MKPPDIIVLTPNGRFEIGKKICLSISGFHPLAWQPSWSIRTALLAIIGFMPTPGHGTIGSLDYPPDERRRLAHRSIDWSCPECGRIHDLLPPPDTTTETTATQQQQEEMRDIVNSVALKTEEEIAEEKTKTGAGESVAEAEKADEKTDATPTSTTSTSQSPATSGVVTAAASSSITSTATSTTTTTTTTTRSARRVDIAQNRSSHVYDLMILVLVAAIAALLYRRISLVQDDGSMGGPTEEL